MAELGPRDLARIARTDEVEVETRRRDGTADALEMSSPMATALPRPQKSAVETPATGLLAALGGLCFAAHMLVAGNYGYFRDELYYLADGQHLQAGYVDHPMLMGWLAALLRVTVGDGLVAIHVVPALAHAAVVVVTGLMARELGGGRAAQLVAGVAALFCVDFMATGSIFSMDVLDQLWWALVGLIVARLLRRDEPRSWLLVGVVGAVALLAKLTFLFFGLALVLALVVTPERRHLRTRWPWLAGAIALLGLAPYVAWNAANGWPTVDFYRDYGGVGTSPPAFLAAQVGQMNPIAVPFAAAGLVFYFRRTGARHRLLGWAFLFASIELTFLRTKPYFLAPAYPLLFAAGAVAFEGFRPPGWLGWVRPAYVAVLALVGVLLAPALMPILPPATVARIYGHLEQPLADRLGWDDLTRTVERVYSGLDAPQRARACVLASNYGEAGALSRLAAPGRLPPVISGHNNYHLWGPDGCTGQALILVGYPLEDVKRTTTHATLAATHRCEYCVAFEREVPIVVVSDPEITDLAPLWPALKHFS